MTRPPLKKNMPYTIMNERRQTTTIDLEEFFASMKAEEATIAQLTDALLEARDKQASEQECVDRIIISCLNNGETTGDPFQDELIRWLGLDKRALDRFMAFNQRLIAAKGQELLLTCSYRIPTSVNSGTNQIVYATHDGCILGILSGERMSIEMQPTEATIVIPLAHYVAWNWRQQKGGMQMVSAPLELTSCPHRQPNILTLRSHICQPEAHAEDQVKMAILLGAEIDEPKTRPLIKDMRAELRAAIPEEPLQRANI